MLFRYIFKKDIRKWESRGWEYCGDLHVIGSSDKTECLIKKRAVHDGFDASLSFRHQKVGSQIPACPPAAHNKESKL